MSFRVWCFSKDHAATFYYKYFGIILLVLQQSSMPILTRLSRYREADIVFITTVNVLVMELIKFSVCSVIVIIVEKSFRRYLTQIRQAIVNDPVDTVKICLPAMIYSFQNNLYYIALTHLDAALFYLLYQAKIITTTILLRVMLGRKFSTPQWIAILLLIIGATDLQLQYEPKRINDGIEQNQTLGLMAVFAMCITSAFAGVFLEKILKESSFSIWLQNVRLSLTSIPICLAAMIIKDHSVIRKDGIFRGFDLLVWTMTISNCMGGIIISIVVKYADNILKAYAQSMAIIAAAIGSWYLFEFTPNIAFVCGAIIVILSVYIYTAYRYETK